MRVSSHFVFLTRIVGVLILLLCATNSFAQANDQNNRVNATECYSYEFFIGEESFESASECYGGNCTGDIRNDDGAGACECQFEGTGGSCKCQNSGSARICKCTDKEGGMMVCRLVGNSCRCESRGTSDKLSCKTSLDNNMSCGCNANGSGAACGCTGSGSSQICQCESDEGGRTTCHLLNDGSCHCE